MSIKDYLRKAGNQALRLEKGLIEGDYFDYDDDASFLEKGLKNVGSFTGSLARPGQIVSRMGEEQLGGRDFDFGSDEALDLITAIPAFKALKVANPKLAYDLTKNFTKDFREKGFKKAMDVFGKKSGISTGFNDAMKYPIKDAAKNRTSAKQLKSLVGLGKDQDLTTRAVRGGLTGLAGLEGLKQLSDEAAEETKAQLAVEEEEEKRAERKSLNDLEGSGQMSGDIEIKRRAPMQGAQYNPNSPAPSLNLARTLGTIDPKDKSGMASRIRTMQNRSMDESNKILKGEYDDAARTRAAQDRFDETENSIRSKWNNSRTGKESGLSWDELDDETKRGMRKRMYGFYDKQTQATEKPAAQPMSQSTGSPMSTKYSPVFGEQGFTGYEDTKDGRFIQSAGVGQKDMLTSLIKQDSADAVNKSKFQDNNPFGSEYRPLARKPIGTGPTPRTDSMMKELNMRPQGQQLDVINSFRKKRGEDEIYNPFV